MVIFFVPWVGSQPPRGSKISLQNLNFFTIGSKKFHPVGSKNTWAKDRFAPYLLRFRSMIGLVRIGSLLSKESDFRIDLSMVQSRALTFDPRMVKNFKMTLNASNSWSVWNLQVVQDKGNLKNITHCELIQWEEKIWRRLISKWKLLFEKNYIQGIICDLSKLGLSLICHVKLLKKCCCCLVRLENFL